MKLNCTLNVLGMLLPILDIGYRVYWIEGMRYIAWLLFFYYKKDIKKM